MYHIVFFATFVLPLVRVDTILYFEHLRRIIVREIRVGSTSLVGGPYFRACGVAGPNSFNLTTPIALEKLKSPDHDSIMINSTASSAKQGVRLAAVVSKNVP